MAITYKVAYEMLTQNGIGRRRRAYPRRVWGSRCKFYFNISPQREPTEVEKLLGIKKDTKPPIIVTLFGPNLQRRFAVAGHAAVQAHGLHSFEVFATQASIRS